MFWHGITFHRKWPIDIRTIYIVSFVRKFIIFLKLFCSILLSACNSSIFGYILQSFNNEIELATITYCLCLNGSNLNNSIAIFFILIIFDLWSTFSVIIIYISLSLFSFSIVGYFIFSDSFLVFWKYRLQ